MTQQKKKNINKLLKILICCILSLNLVGYTNSLVKPKLKFKESGTFKIVQFTDIHEKVPLNVKTLELMNKVLDEEKPDFVILTGDNIDGRYCSFKDTKKVIREIVRPMEDRKIYWAAVLGNHDNESNNFSREAMMKLYKKYKYNIDCSYNYNILVNNSNNTDPIFNMYMLDSGTYALGGYGFISSDQINWYTKTSMSLKGNIPAIMFFHIPIQEYKNSSSKTVLSGERNEEECTQILNTGLFNKILEMGDVKAIFVGHDHTNDYITIKNKIALGYGRCTGYDAPSNIDFERGARVFLIRERNPSAIKTWIRKLNDKTNELE